MSENQPEEQPRDERDGGLSGPGAGLGATGRHADDFAPGEDDTVSDYGDPSGIGTDADKEDAARDE